MNEGPWCRSVLPGDSDPVPRDRSVDQLSLVNGAWVRGPAGSTTCPARVGPWYECPWGRPAIPGASGPSPKACGVDKLLIVDQLSRVTRGRVRSFAGVDHLSSCLGLNSEARGVDQISRVPRARFEFPRGRPAVPDNSRTGPMACGSTSCPGRLRPLPEDPRARPALPCDLGTSPRDQRSTPLPGDMGPGPRARGFYQLNRVTRARIQGPAVSTSSPG